jgi:hypothetical protein
MLMTGDAAAALRVLSNSLGVYLPTHQHVALVPYMLIEMQDKARAKQNLFGRTYFCCKK